MNDLRHDPDAPDAIDPVAERTAYLRQWQPVPPGVQPWGRTVMHTPDGGVYTNVDPPTPEPPDLRTVGDRVAECEQAIAALQDETGSQSWNMRQLLGRVETLERTQAEIMARLAAVEGYGEKANYAAQVAAQHEDRLVHLERVTHRLLNPGEQEDGEQTTPAQDRGTILSDFYSEVCREAEGIMAQSGMVSGAHWNAMRRVLQRHGVEVNE